MMKFIKRIVLCLTALVLCGKVVMAEENLIKSEYSYRRYTTLDGLPNIMAISFHQDSKGLIWIATDDGFASFDGIKFTSYFTNTGRSFRCFRSKPNDELWAYSLDSVFVLDKNRTVVRSFKPTDKGLFRGLTLSSYMPEDYFILEYSKERKKLLMKQKGDSMEIIVENIPELDEISESNPYLDLHNNKLFLPCWRNKSVNIFDLNSKRITNIENLAAEFFLKHSSLGLLAFASDGIYKFNGNSFSKLHDIHLERNQKAIELKDESIIIMDRKTIYRYVKGEIEMLVSNPSTYFINIFADREENIWLATHSMGIYNFFHFDFRNITLKDEQITSIVENQEGNYIIGTLYGNLYNYSNEKTEKLNYPRRGIDIDFRSGASLFNDAVFIPRGDGILKYKNKQFSWVIAKEDPRINSGDWYNKILPAQNGDFVVHNFLKLIIFDENEKLKREINVQDIGVDQINNTIIGKNGEIIAGCSGGKIGNLLIIKDTVINRDLKYYGSIYSVEQDFEGNIWGSSRNNLLLMTGDTLGIVHNFKETTIRAIKIINSNYLLISTTKGVYFFNYKRYLENGDNQLIHYDYNTGMNGIEPKKNALYRDSKGLIWLIASEGVITFDPELLIRKNITPIFSIKKCFVSFDNVNWEDAGGAKKMIFNHRQNNIRFSFIGIKYSGFENVRYYYRLLGFQNNWSEPTKNREITFNNLTPGNYVFEIYADAGTDDSCCETQSFAFSIKPAFWQTTWFIVSCIASLMLASAGVALYIQRKKNKVLLEKLRAEKELNELRISSIRLKTIPHFNANVLAAIEYYLTNRTKEEAMRILGVYSDFTFKTLSEVDMPARPLSEELAYVKMYLDLEKIRFMEKFDFRIQVEEEVDKNVKLPNMILHTYCENAVKHGLMPLKSGGLLTINVSQRDRFIIVCVEDNGVGRAYAAQNPQTHSSKQGLSILDRQIEIYNRFNREKIKQQTKDLLNDGKPNGTLFRVEVPVDYNFNI